MGIKTTIVLLIAAMALGTFSQAKARMHSRVAHRHQRNATSPVASQGTAMWTVDALPGHQGHQGGK